MFPRHPIGWWFMLVVAAAVFASYPAYRTFRSVDDGPTRLSISEPKASLVIPKEHMDAGKISYFAILPRHSSCLSKIKEENQMTLVAGTGGCKMNMMFNHDGIFFNTNSATDSMFAKHQGSGLIPVEVFDDGNVSLSYGEKIPSDCKVLSNPLKNLFQDGKVVDFSVENIVGTCNNLAIEFDSRYKLFEPIVSSALQRPLSASGTSSDVDKSAVESVWIYLSSYRCSLFVVRALVPVGLFCCTLLRYYFGFTRFLAVSGARFLLVSALSFPVVYYEKNGLVILETLLLFFIAFVCSVLTMYYGAQNPAGQLFPQQPIPAGQLFPHQPNPVAQPFPQQPNPVVQFLPQQPILAGQLFPQQGALIQRIRDLEQRVRDLEQRNRNLVMVILFLVGIISCQFAIISNYWIGRN